MRCSTAEDILILIWLENLLHKVHSCAVNRSSKCSDIFQLKIRFEEISSFELFHCFAVVCFFCKWTLNIHNH